MLKSVLLQNFRSYKKSSFDFSPKTTLIVGRNTAGKTNLIESIYYLTYGKSFRTEKDLDTLSFGKEFARITGATDEEKLEVVLSNIGDRFSKKLLINGISKRRADFVGVLSSVLFSPEDLELIIGSPGLRRSFLDDILEQTDREYRIALISYTKALRQRNSLLERVKDGGVRKSDQFSYWDNLLIGNGQIVTKKRSDLIEYLNRAKKDLFKFKIYYDLSEISVDRLLKYKDAEEGTGVTLVGPHRDDFYIEMEGEKNLKTYGSRGQQRLGVLQLKILELNFMEESEKTRPLFLLDDIFSELDSSHIDLVMSVVPLQQTIITTTHKEFVDKRHMKEMELIELGNGTV